MVAFHSLHVLYVKFECIQTEKKDE